MESLPVLYRHGVARHADSGQSLLYPAFPGRALAQYERQYASAHSRTGC